MKTIFITGASRGMGKIWVEAFLKCGDKVAATARNLDTLNELKEKYGDAILPVHCKQFYYQNCCFLILQPDNYPVVSIGFSGFGLFLQEINIKTKPIIKKCFRIIKCNLLSNSSKENGLNYLLFTRKKFRASVVT